MGMPQQTCFGSCFMVVVVAYMCNGFYNTAKTNSVTPSHDNYHTVHSPKIVFRKHMVQNTDFMNSAKLLLQLAIETRTCQSSKDTHTNDKTHKVQKLGFDCAPCPHS